MKPTEYVRPAADELVRRLAEPRRFILALVGPRQVGKTTLLHQAATRSKLTMHYASADEPTLRAPNWVGQHWEAARRLAKDSGSEGVILALDEVQKLHDHYIADINKALEHKEKDILTV